jgi:hypothetical protein
MKKNTNCSKHIHVKSDGKLDSDNTVKLSSYQLIRNRPTTHNPYDQIIHKIGVKILKNVNKRLKKLSNKELSSSESCETMTLYIIKYWLQKIIN